MFDHILVATDLSARAQLATEKAVQLAHQFKSKITMLNVHEEFMDKEEMQMLRVSVEKMESEFRNIAVRAKEEIRRSLNELHAEDIRVEFLLKKGDAKKAILETAEELDVDLIVMGTNGRDNIHDYLLGTTSEYVARHTKQPLLIVPITKGK